MQCTGYRKRSGLLLQAARPVDHCTPSPNIWCCYCPHRCRCCWPTASPKCQYQAQQVLILPGQEAGEPSIPICSQFCRCPTLPWHARGAGAHSSVPPLHDSPSAFPSKPNDESDERKGQLRQETMVALKNSGAAIRCEGLLTEEQGGTAEFWQRRKLDTECKALR